MRKADQSNEPFKIVQASRKLTAYSVFENEMNSIGNLNTLEQVFLNAMFTSIGAFISAVVTITTGSNGSVVWILFWVSLIIAIICCLCFYLIRQSGKEMKNNIRQ